MAIGWDDLGDLRSYKTRQDIQKKLQTLHSDSSSQKHRSLACWQFVHDIQPGDVAFAKQGFSQLLGYGIVQPGGYVHDASRSYFKNVRKVEWLKKGVWAIPDENKVAPKALTEITDNPDLISHPSHTNGRATATANDLSHTSDSGRHHNRVLVVKCQTRNLGLPRRPGRRSPNLHVPQ